MCCIMCKMDGQEETMEEPMVNLQSVPAWPAPPASPSTQSYSSKQKKD